MKRIHPSADRILRYAKMTLYHLYHTHDSTCISSPYRRHNRHHHYHHHHPHHLTLTWLVVAAPLTILQLFSSAFSYFHSLLWAVEIQPTQSLMLFSPLFFCQPLILVSESERCMQKECNVSRDSSSSSLPMRRSSFEPKRVTRKLTPVSSDKIFFSYNLFDNPLK